MEKKLIIVSAPPASGKTYVSMKLAENLRHVVYLDKDDLVPLSNVAYDVTNQPRAREGLFFEEYLRNVEYDVILKQGFEALKYEDIVLINAPFSREIRNKEWVDNLRKTLKEQYNGTLVIIWVTCPVDVVHQRMIDRKSPRDVYKLQDWETFVATHNFSTPTELYVEGDPYSLILFDNGSEESYEASMRRTVNLLEERAE